MHLETGFYDPLLMTKLKTPQTLVIKKAKAANGIMQLHTDKALFARLAARVRRNRAVDMRVV